MEVVDGWESIDLVAVTVSSTVIDSTGNWISEVAPAARAFSRSSRNDSIASASPSLPPILGPPSPTPHV